MLGGVRNAAETADDLARDVAAGANMATASGLCGKPREAGFVGITGLEDRSDGRGVALRFAVWPEVQGLGYAREAAGAALWFGHDRAHLRRIVAAAREANFASRTVFGGIGMVPCERFTQRGHTMVLFESVRPTR